MRKPVLHLLPGLLLAGLAGCSSGGSDSGSDSSGNGGNNGGGSDRACVAGNNGVSTCTVDASAYDKYVYINLADGEVVDLSDAEAATSDAWDIAFRRYAVKTNGGSSGSGKRGAELVVAQEDFYNDDGTPKQAVFEGATADGELNHLTGSLSVPGSWIADKRVSALSPEPVEDASNCNAISPPAYRISYGWYTYHGGCLPTPHSLSANSDTGWLLKSAAGNSYSRFRATSVSFSNANGLSAGFEFTVQPVGASAFSENRSWQISNLASGERCYDFDAGVEEACSGSAWDVKLRVEGQNISLGTSSGPTGPGTAGALGPQDWITISGYANGTTAVAGAPYAADTSSSVLDTQGWYAYNISGSDHRLWPNYRVYMLNANTDDAASKLYALQVIDYYKDTGASGEITFRFREVTR